MNSRSLKLLTASTAFIAVASVGHAATITGTVTSTINTSDTIGATIVSGTSIVSVTGAPAFLISSTNPTSNTISINTGGIVRSTTSATILSGLTTNAGVTLNNSGSIINTGNGPAIDLTGMTNGATITNTGTISGSITLGNGTNIVSSTGLTNGTITGGTSNNTANFTNGTHVGNLNFITGSSNTTVISNTTVNGNYIGGAGVDNVTVRSGSVFNGNITTGSGTDIITVSRSTINGNISTSAGASGGLTTLNLINATVSGTITDGTTGDADVLNINGQNTFTTKGDITGFETVNINTNTVVNNVLGGAAAVNIASGKTLTANQSFQATAALTNAGELDIAAGKTVQAATYVGTGGTLGIGLVSSNTTSGIGHLVLTGGTVGNTSLTINVGTGSNYIASGTTYLMVDGSAGTASTSTILNANTGVYRFSTVVSNTSDVYLKVGRVATGSVVTGSDNQSIAGALDRLGAGATGSLATVQGEIGSQTSAAGVNRVVESLTPSIEGAGAASVAITVDTGNQISNRLASVRSTSGVATGDPMASKHMWVEGFGSTVSQDDHKGNAGYDANAGGVSVGVDTDSLAEGYTTGLAVSYGHGTVDSNASSNASTDIDTYVGTLYGSRVLDNGVFVNGQLGLGYNKYDMSRNVIGVGNASGDTNGWQGTAKLEAGRDYALLNKFTVTPLASLQYTYLNMDSYTETGAGGASLRVNPEALNTFDAGAGGQVAYAIPLTDGGTLKPSMHAKYIYRMGDTRMGTTSNFTGGGSSFNTDGVETDRSSVNLGAALLLTTVAGTDLSLNYDADIRSSLIGHTGQLKARWAF